MLKLSNQRQINEKVLSTLIGGVYLNKIEQIRNK